MRLDAVELLNPQGVQIAKNTDFSLGSRYWGRIADKNYLPWHIDNLFIELLVQHGLVHPITHKSAEYSCNVEKGHNPLKN